MAGDWTGSSGRSGWAAAVCAAVQTLELADVVELVPQHVWQVQLGCLGKHLGEAQVARGPHPCRSTVPPGTIASCHGHLVLDGRRPTLGTPTSFRKCWMMDGMATGLSAALRQPDMRHAEPRRTEMGTGLWGMQAVCTRASRHAFHGRLRFPVFPLHACQGRQRQHMEMFAAAQRHCTVPPE